MDSSPDEILIEIPYVIKVYKDGRVVKLGGTNVVPAGIDPNTGVQSKDVVISPEADAFVRIYLPMTTISDGKKLPLLVYFHGGGFIIETAASPMYHNFLNLVSSESNVVVVSVDYSKAPEHPVPTCYDDSWEAVKWVSQHVNGNGLDTWLNDYVDFSHVFFAGDSAGGNIAHHMAIRVGSEIFGRVSGESLNLEGIILLHPYFWGEDRMGSESSDSPWTKTIKELWLIAHPGASGSDDPLLNPDKDPKVSDLSCSRVLVCVAGKDILKDRGLYYKVILGKNGWKGDIEVIVDKDEDHVFFLGLMACNSNVLLHLCHYHIRTKKIPQSLQESGEQTTNTIPTNTMLTATYATRQKNLKQGGDALKIYVNIMPTTGRRQYKSQI